MISVIVPIYNVEKYVEPCIGSILNSTYRDIELILVDDGSTDASGAICDRYAAKDQRVRVIHKANGGVSSARNQGLQVATGEYICFVDGDDVIHPDMLETLVCALQEGDYDFSMCSMKRVNAGEAIDMGTIDTNALTKKVITYEDFCHGLYGHNQDGAFYNYLVNKLFRRELINGERFTELRMCEDIEWIHRVCLKMKSAVFVAAEFYFYIQHDSSATHEPMNPKFLDWIRAYDKCLNNIPKDNVELRNNCMLYLFKVMALVRNKSRHTQYEQEVKALNREIAEKRKRELRQSNVGGLKKWRVLTFYHFPWTYNLFMKACDLVARLKG